MWTAPRWRGLCAITLATAVLAGFLPGLKLSAGNIQDALKNSGQGMSAGRRHEQGLRAFMVISEVALACLLLIGAGLLLRSFLNALDVDLGFQASHAAAIRIDYDDGNNLERRSAVLQEILRQTRAIAGIEAAGIADMLPLGRNRNWGLRAKGTAPRKGEDNSALVRVVTPGYIGAMGIRLRSDQPFHSA